MMKLSLRCCFINICGSCLSTQSDFVSSSSICFHKPVHIGTDRLIYVCRSASVSLRPVAEWYGPRMCSSPAGQTRLRSLRPRMPLKCGSFPPVCHAVHSTAPQKTQDETHKAIKHYYTEPRIECLYILMSWKCVTQCLFQLSIWFWHYVNDCNIFHVHTIIHQVVMHRVCLSFSGTEYAFVFTPVNPK